MPRLKFLVFALLVLGLWSYHLWLISPAVTLRAAEQASASVLAAPGAVALQVEAQRSSLQAAVVKLAASPALQNVGPKGAKEPPTNDRFNAVRAVLFEGLPEPLRATAVVGVSTEAGALVATGTADPGAPPEGVDLAAISQAQGGGTVLSVAGVPYLFYAVPLVIAEKNEVKVAGAAFAGLPVLPDAKGLVERISKEQRLSAVGILSGGALIASVGLDKALLEKASKLKPGQVAPVAEGPVTTFGPLHLPMLAQSSVQSVGARGELAGTPYSVVAVASGSKNVLEALAEYQRFAVFGLGGLLLFTLVFTILLKGPVEEPGAHMVMPPPMPLPPQLKKDRGEEPAFAQALPGQAGPEASPDDFSFPGAGAGPPAPEFPASKPSQLSRPSQISTGLQQAAPPPPTGTGSTGLQPLVNASISTTGMQPNFAPPASEPPSRGASLPPPVADPFESFQPAPPPQFVPPPPVFAPPPDRLPRSTMQQHVFAPPPSNAPRAPLPGPATTLNDDDGARTMAYPAFKPPPAAPLPPSFLPTPAQHSADPFALAAANSGEPPVPAGEEDYNPDATRVAAVPQELIKAARSASGVTGERMAVRSPPGGALAMPKVSAAMPASAPPNEEERHYQDVFRDFIATREKCGEAADGLTFEKFKGKLLKNREQLVQKYNCRTVRFQVYVKDGKAALKATPVKD